MEKIKQSQPRIRVYTTPACPYCLSLKEFLKEHQIGFEEIDVAGNSKMTDFLIEKTGQAQVPVIEIDGQWISGFDREKISKILKIK